MRYRILEENSVYRLENAVSEAISKGWRPQGGVAIDSRGGGSFLQAVIKD